MTLVDRLFPLRRTPARRPVHPSCPCEPSGHSLGASPFLWPRFQSPASAPEPCRRSRQSRLFFREKDDEACCTGGFGSECWRRVARQWWLFALPILQREGRQTAPGQIGPLSSFVAPGGRHWWLFALPVLSERRTTNPLRQRCPPVHHPSRVAHKALCQPRHIPADRPRQSPNDRACFPSILQ